MSKFIKLTVADSINFAKQCQMCINIENVKAFRNVIKGDSAYCVMESAEEILQLIKEAESGT